MQRYMQDAPADASSSATSQAREHSSESSDGTHSTGSRLQMETLGNMSSMSARHQEFLQRKAERKSSRAKKSVMSTLDTHGFLSHVPEVNADIAYRFCFIVLGVAARSSVEAACSTEAMEHQALPSSSSASHQREEVAYRCFSHVPYPHGSEEAFNAKPGRLNPMKFSSYVPKLCKLIFDPRPGDWNIPVFRTRMEALSSALICTLVIDPAHGEPSFHEQLLQYERWLDQIKYTQNSLRPARVILLCRNAVEGYDESLPPAPGHLSWMARLEEHQMCVDENTWKFGPLNLKDQLQLHSAFATIASKRIMRGSESQGEDSDGSQDSDPPPCYEAEVDDECFPIEEEDEVEPPWLAHLVVNTSESEGEVETEGLLAIQGGPPRKYVGSRWGALSVMQKGAA